MAPNSKGTTTENGSFGFAADTIGPLTFQAAVFNNGKPVTLKNLDLLDGLSDPKKNPTGVVFPIGSFTVGLV